MAAGSGEEGRNIDYLAGTSLDESDDRVWPPRRQHVMHLSASAREERQRDVEIARQQRYEAAQMMEDTAYADQAWQDLERYKGAEAGFKIAFQNALKAWSQHAPVGAHKFMEWMELAICATSTVVAAMSVTLWYPIADNAVRHRLTALVKYYHGEAYLLLQYHTAQNRVGRPMQHDPRSDEGLVEQNQLDDLFARMVHQEARYAAASTIVTNPRPNRHGILHIGSWEYFGHGDALAAVGTFHEYGTSMEECGRYPSENTWVPRLKQILAAFRVRKALTTLESPIRWTGQGQLEYTKTADAFVMGWIDGACTYLEKSKDKINNLSNRKEVIPVFVQVFNEISRFRHHFAELAGLRQRVLEEYCPKVKLYKEALAEAIAKDSDSDDEDEIIDPRVIELHEELVAMEGDFQEFEDKHGRIIGWDWNNMAQTRSDGPDA